MNWKSHQRQVTATTAIASGLLMLGSLAAPASATIQPVPDNSTVVNTSCKSPGTPKYNKNPVVVARVAVLVAEYKAKCQSYANDYAATVDAAWAEYVAAIAPYRKASDDAQAAYKTALAASQRDPSNKELRRLVNEAEIAATAARRALTKASIPHLRAFKTAQKEAYSNYRRNMGALLAWYREEVRKVVAANR